MKKRKKDNTIFKFLISVSVFIVLIIILWTPLLNILSSMQETKAFVLKFKIFSPIAIILLTTLQVFFAPIPGQLAGFVSGYLFGTVLGTLYSMIGLILGSYIVFFVSRRYGRPFLEKVVEKKTFNKYDKLLNSKSAVLVLFFIYLLPALPDDLVCFIAGATKIRMRTLIFISALGRLPGFFVLNLTGDATASSQDITLILAILIGSLILVVIGCLFKQDLERAMMKVVKKIGKTNLF